MNKLHQGLPWKVESPLKANNFILALLSILVLVATHVYIFFGHYIGERIFPDDFLHLYRSPLYAWYADNSIFSPGTWTPYGNVGHPTSLSVQSGAFYLPLTLLDWLGIDFTYENASRFQAAHTLIGGLGSYVFFKRYFPSPGVALIAAIAYMSSATFVGNQQHADVIRGSALLLWCLVFSSANWLREWSPARIAALGITASLFFIGSYPGLVASTALVLAILVSFDLLELPNRSTRLKYVVQLAGGWMLAALTAAVKYGPPLLQSSEMLTTGGATSVYGMLPQFMVTLTMPFGSPALGGNDITVRSIYIAPLILAAMFFVPRLNSTVWRGVCLILLFVVFTPQIESWQAVTQHFPLQSISRMKMFDFRPALAIGLIFVGASTLDCIQAGSLSLVQGVRGAIAAVAFAFACWISADLIGLSSADILSGLLPFSLGLALVLILSYAAQRHRPMIIVVCVGFSAWAAAAFHFNPGHRSTWVLEPPAFMKQVMGVDLNKSPLAHRKSIWGFRPARVAPAKNVATLSDNRGYYTQEFFLLAIDAGNRLKRTLNLLHLLTTPESEWLKPFLLAPSKIWVMPETSQLSASDLRRCGRTEDCSVQEPDTIRMTEFRLDGATYEVSLRSPAQVVENEAFYPGWRGKVCRNLECSSVIEAFPATDVLRAWQLPAGQYTFVTQFKDSTLRLGVHLFWTGFLGIAGLALIGLAMCFRRKVNHTRFNHQVSNI